MSFIVKLMLILFGLAYLISPVDLIPDLLLPWVGWIDDGVVLWSIYYLIRYGELPWFLFRKKAGNRFPGPGSRTAHNTQKNKSGENPGTENSNPAGKKTANAASDKSPYDILGVDKTASWPEIQSAYRKKIKQYHPDKLAHLGKEFADLANEKFLEIQSAYGILKQKNKP